MQLSLLETKASFQLFFLPERRKPSQQFKKVKLQSDDFKNEYQKDNDFKMNAGSFDRYQHIYNNQREAYNY